MGEWEWRGYGREGGIDRTRFWKVGWLGESIEEELVLTGPSDRKKVHLSSDAHSQAGGRRRQGLCSLVSVTAGILAVQTRVTFPGKGQLPKMRLDIQFN